jgi:hypothetical protein
MATALTSPLPSIHPVLDPLIVSLADAAAPASGRTGQSQCEVQIEVEDVLDSGTWRLIGELLNPYDYTTDTAKAVIHKALQGALNPDNPQDILSNTLTEITGILKRYRLKVRDVVDGVPVGAFATLDPAIAWQAGRRVQFQSFNPLTGKAYIFLSSRPTQRRIHPDEPLVLQFLALQSSADADVVLNIIYTDGTTEEQRYVGEPIVANRVYAFTAPAPKNFTKPAAKITVSVDAAEFTGTKPTQVYNTITKPTPYLQLLYFRNSLGGWDSIACSGKNEEFSNMTGETFEGQEYSYSASSAGVEGGNVRAFNQRATDSFVFRTGYMSQAEHAAMRDLLLRNEAYHYNNTELWKLIITNSTFRVKADDEYLYATEITARYAFDQVAY